MKNALLLLISFLGLGAVVVAAPVEAPSRSPVRIQSATVSPAQLTLPSGGFHYDPLLAVCDAEGKPVWVDVRIDLVASSSDTLVATVDGRARIATGKPGTASITIRSAADPRVQGSLALTVVDATVNDVQVVGGTAFDLYVGQTQPLEATARLSTGQIIPHAEYSSDLDVLVGAKYATLVDGLGIAALQPCPPGTPIEIGFCQGGATAMGRLSSREIQLTGAQLRLGGRAADQGELTMPSGYHALLEVFGTFEDGSARPLQEGQEYTVSLAPASGFAFTSAGTTSGYLTQAAAGRTTELGIDLPKYIQGRVSDLVAQVRSVDGTAVRGLDVAFANYPDDRRLLSPGFGPGCARELCVLADFAGLSGYRVSALDALSITGDAGMDCRLSRSAQGWPALSGATLGAGNLDFGLGELSTSMTDLCLLVPQTLSVTPCSETVAIELGGNLFWRTLVDYGDGHGPLDRALDYPVLEDSFDLTRAVCGSWRPQPDGMRYFFRTPGSGRDGFVFQARDALRRPLEAIGSGLLTRTKVDAVRQSDAGRPAGR